MSSLSTIDYYAEQVDIWSAEATRLDDLQQEMTDVARRLRSEFTPLKTVFEPLHELHTPATWEGEAARSSRNRLIAHQDRLNSVDITITGLADDLDTRAAGLRTERDIANDKADTSRQQKTKAIGDYRDRLAEEQLEQERLDAERALATSAP